MVRGKVTWTQDNRPMRGFVFGNSLRNFTKHLIFPDPFMIGTRKHDI